MFTTEIRINGTLVGHVYGHNEGEINAKGETKYSYEYYEPELRKIVKGHVWFHRDEGIRHLVAKILLAAAPSPAQKRKRKTS